MLAPVDPRPYAGPTDLVTAADVAEWLDTLHKGPPAERIFGVQDAVAALDARLDRERRQACRRGALACWREAKRLATSPQPETIYWPDVAEYVARALAFRAAARAR